MYLVRKSFIFLFFVLSVNVFASGSSDGYSGSTQFLQTFKSRLNEGVFLRFSYIVLPRQKHWFELTRGLQSSRHKRFLSYS